MRDLTLLAVTVGNDSSWKFEEREGPHHVKQKFQNCCGGQWTEG